MSQARLQRTLRVTFAGMVVNALLATGKIAAGIAGNSNALIADGVESLADLMSSVVVWRGVTLAAEPPDEEHPYGHGKAEPLAAAVVSSMLLFAALWIAVESVRELFRPQGVPAPFTLVVLMVVIVVKELLFRSVLKTSEQVESTAVRTDAWHHRSDAITSAFAFMGIGLALLGGIRWQSADDIAAILAAGVIGFNGWRLLRPALSELMDTSPELEWRSRIYRIAEATPDVVRVEKCIVRKMGFEYFADMHLEVDPLMTVSAAHLVAHNVKDNIRGELPQVRDVLVHIEPARSQHKESTIKHDKTR
jgi:cation diffusion facilitator family transporter